MKIYVASSWRNQLQPSVISYLKGRGHDVYDFRNPPNRSGFCWEQTVKGRPTSPLQMLDTLIDPIAVAGFQSDMQALATSDLCILLMPAGLSAHLELGFACGARKRTIIYMPEGAPTLWADLRGGFEPELMWKMADRIVVSPMDFRFAIDAEENMFASAAICAP